SALVAGSVVWNANEAATFAFGATPQSVAATEPVLMMVANAVTVPVAELPMVEERLAGRTAASRVDGGFVDAQAAPLNDWSVGPPTSAVVPSLDSATDMP